MILFIICRESVSMNIAKKKPVAKQTESFSSWIIVVFEPGRRQITLHSKICQRRADEFTHCMRRSIAGAGAAAAAVRRGLMQTIKAQRVVCCVFHLIYLGGPQ
jgi:hypothetical protein